MNISVFEPASAELLALLSAVEMSGRLVAGASWLIFGEGVVYRWTDDVIAGDLSCRLTSAELGQIWERERRLANLPKLLFHEQDCHVIIRL
jgi:hypothetical protein